MRLWSQKQRRTPRSVRLWSRQPRNAPPSMRRLSMAAAILAVVLSLSMTGVFASAAQDALPPVETAPAEQVETLTSAKVIPYDTQVIEDDSLYIGERVLVRGGSVGFARVTSQRVSVDGNYIYRRQPVTEVIIDPIPAIVREGTKFRTFSTGTYHWPIGGVLTSYFGPRSGFGSSNHKGLDIAGAAGTEIYAADAGLVIRADSQYSGFGNLIIIQHDNGDQTYYAHQSAFAVSAGDYVEQGQLIGYRGNTGISSGPHLHFEIRLGGETPVNPLDYLPAENPLNA